MSEYDEMGPLALTFAEIFERIGRLEEAAGISGLTPAGIAFDEAMSAPEDESDSVWPGCGVGRHSGDYEVRLATGDDTSVPLKVWRLGEKGDC